MGSHSEHKVQVVHSHQMTIWHELNLKKKNSSCSEEEVLLGKKQEPSDLENLCMWLKQGAVSGFMWPSAICTGNEPGLEASTYTADLSDLELFLSLSKTNVNSS